ncbi:hypothetical protein HHK36_008017 [Tetracentron sinense]|uniref:NmrA-like domain-containing protein n=1 Tax=Tetracentron sinense TaxID=13715 RepID=A0A834ZDX5_TETSI|nr:hypothetical protein HHK36_008017 [Tetracentron sinense]
MQLQDHYLLTPQPNGSGPSSASSPSTPLDSTSTAPPGQPSISPSPLPSINGDLLKAAPIHLVVDLTRPPGAPSLHEASQDAPPQSGELEEHEKLVSVLKQVDVVISTLPYPQILDQFKIIHAMKIASNIKSFFPSDFGNEENGAIALTPFQAFLDRKKKIRRATEAAGIPHTFVSGNSFGAYFVDYLLHPRERREEVLVYGSGHAKDNVHKFVQTLIMQMDCDASLAVLNFEKDIAAYTIKAANDPRTCNRIIIYNPPGNIISQLDLISSWEKKTGQNLRKVYVSEEEMMKLSESAIPFHPLYMYYVHHLVTTYSGIW